MQVVSFLYIFADDLSNIGVSCDICEIFKNTFFTASPVVAFVASKVAVDSNRHSLVDFKNFKLLVAFESTSM